MTTTSASISFDHVSLVVADTQRSLAFYKQIFGLEPLLSRPDLSFDGAWLDIGGGQQIHLLEVPSVDPVEGRPEHGGRDRHIALRVGDLGALITRLEQNGVVFTRSASGRDAVFFRDPDGNTFEVLPQISAE